jgi:transcriptional regulator
MSEAQIEFLRGALDMLVLKIVALGPSHGYAIAQRLQQISKDFFLVHQGSLYPALHRLEDRGWLQAEWKESETGREAKFHSLTKKGRKQMDTEVQNWERLCAAGGEDDSDAAPVGTRLLANPARRYTGRARCARSGEWPSMAEWILLILIRS